MVGPALGAGKEGTPTVATPARTPEATAAKLEATLGDKLWRQFAASFNWRERISFFNLSAFSSLLSSALDLFVGGQKELWCTNCAAEGRAAGSVWTICFSSNWSSMEYPGKGCSSPLRMACHSSPFKGSGWPLAASYNVKPRAKMSAFGNCEKSSCSISRGRYLQSPSSTSGFTTDVTWPRSPKRRGTSKH